MFRQPHAIEDITTIRKIISIRAILSTSGGLDASTDSPYVTWLKLTLFRLYSQYSGDERDYEEFLLLGKYPKHSLTVPFEQNLFLHVLKIDAGRSHGSMENRPIYSVDNQRAVFHSPGYKDQGAPIVRLQ